MILNFFRKKLSSVFLEYRSLQSCQVSWRSLERLSRKSDYRPTDQPTRTPSLTSTNVENCNVLCTSSTSVFRKTYHSLVSSLWSIFWQFFAWKGENTLTKNYYESSHSNSLMIPTKFQDHILTFHWKIQEFDIFYT